MIEPIFLEMTLSYSKGPNSRLKDMELICLEKPFSVHLRDSDLRCFLYLGKEFQSIFESFQAPVESEQRSTEESPASLYISLALFFSLKFAKETQGTSYFGWASSMFSAGTSWIVGGNEKSKSNANVEKEKKILNKKLAKVIENIQKGEDTTPMLGRLQDTNDEPSALNLSPSEEIELEKQIEMNLKKEDKEALVQLFNMRKLFSFHSFSKSLTFKKRG